ncbi:MAG: glycosyltransferase family 4 protein [Victivallales bacterium]|nr:glycosyltransferase family 4 protein [Victivallales bacterium]
MRKHLTYLLLSLVAGLVLASLAIRKSCQVHRLTTLLEMLQTEAACSFHLDLTQAGKTTAPLHWEKGVLHGVALRIGHLNGDTQLRPMTALHRFHAEIGALRVLESSGRELHRGNLGVQVSRFTNLTMSPVSLGWIPAELDTTKKELTLEIEVVHPLEDSGERLLLTGKYEVCPQKIQLPICLLTLLASLWGVLACLCLASAWHHFQVVLVIRRRPGGEKILMLYSHWPMWSETFLRQDLTQLQNLNLSIHAVALFPGNCQTQKGWPEVTVLSPKAKPSPENDVGMKHSPVDWMPRSWRAIGSLLRHRRLLKELVAICRKEGIAHIHAEFADLAALLAVKAAERTGCSYSIGVHAWDVFRCKYPANLLYRHASLVIACNQAALAAVKGQCPEVEPRLHLIPHGVDLKAFPFGHRQPKELRILFAGRLIPKKGLPLLLEALAQLVNHQERQATLIVAGDGPMADDCQSLAKQLNVDSCVQWRGRLSQEQVREEMALASCLCLPSVVDGDGDRDGLPNVLVEAMALGLPVVGTRAGSLPDLLTMETGWPLHTPTPELLADAILDAVSQPEEAARRALNAHRQLEYRFDSRKLVAQRAKLLKQAVSSNPWELQ